MRLLEREAYLQAMRGLLTLIRSDARLNPVAAALNESRLLLDTDVAATDSTLAG